MSNDKCHVGTLGDTGACPQSEVGGLAERVFMDRMTSVSHPFSIWTTDSEASLRLLMKTDNPSHKRVTLKTRTPACYCLMEIHCLVEGNV